MKKDPMGFQRRPFLTPLWLTALAALAAVGFAIFAVWMWGTADSTMIVVIRHAEKDVGASAADPPLSEAGKARAALLANMFGDAQALGRLDAIYVSPMMRSRLTAAPLAARLRISEIVVAQDDPRALASRALHEHRGGRVMIVGHNDTVPKIVWALTGTSKIPDIDAEEYGTMYIVTVPRIGHPNVLRLNY